MISFLHALVTHPIIPIFLLANLAIGFWAHSKAKVNSFEDYALASRSLPTGVLVMTLLATRIDFREIAEVGYIFQYGLIETMPIIFFVAGFFFVGTFIAPHLVYFQDNLTTGDLMYRFYGETARCVTGFFGAIFSFLMISSQIRAIGDISEYLLDISPTTMIIVCGSLIVFYSVLGGMRPVSYTDVLQALLMLITFSWIMRVVLAKVGGAKMLYSSFPKEKMLFTAHPKFIYKLKSAFFWALFPNWVLTPPIIQRMLIVQDKRQIRKMWYVSAMLYFLLASAITIIGLATIVGESKFNISDSASKEILLVVIQDCFQSTPWLMDILLLGLLSILLSTIDSYLHTMAVSVVQDILEPIKAFYKQKPIQQSKKILYAKIVIISIGILAIATATLKGSELNNRFFYIAMAVLSPIIIIPLIIGILGVKTDKISWAVFGITYVTAVGGFYVYSWHEYDYFLLSLPLATLAYFLTHIIQNRGIVTLKRSELTVSERLWLPSWSRFKKKVTSWLAAPLHLTTLADQKIVSTPTQSLAFSMLIFALYTFSSVFSSGGVGAANFMEAIHFVGIALCCGLMLGGIWPDKLKPYFPLYWFLTLFYCLSFGGTLAFLHVHEDPVTVILWVVKFTFLAFLVDSTAFCILGGLGSLLACGVWYVCIGSIPTDLWNHYTLIGLGILIGIIMAILLFGRRREQYSSQRLNWNLTASSILGHDLRNTTHMLSGIGNVIDNTFKMSEPAANSEGKQGYWIPKQRGKFLEDYAQKLTQKSTETKTEIKNFMGFMEQQVMGWLEQKKMSIHKVSQHVVASMKDKYANSMEMSISCTKDFEANVFSVFPNVIVNLIKNASIHGQATQVSIKVDGIKRTLTVRDNGKGISADVLPRIFDLNFTTGDKSKKNAGIGLAFVKMVMNASFGKVSCHSRKGDKKSFTEFVMEFPQV